MFEGLFQPTHLLIVLIIVLIIFGPGKLPDLGKALGQGIREFREGTSGAAPGEPPTAQPVVEQAQLPPQTENTGWKPPAAPPDS